MVEEVHAPSPEPTMRWADKVYIRVSQNADHVLILFTDSADIIYAGVAMDPADAEAVAKEITRLAQQTRLYNATPAGQA